MDKLEDYDVFSVRLTVFQTSFLSFVTFDIMLGKL